MKTQTITDYEIIRHGVEHSDYFQGCGASFTKFEHVQTGIGDTEQEAFEDALECMSSGHSFADGELERVEREAFMGMSPPDSRDVQTACGLTDEEMDGNLYLPYWHVSIRYNVADVPDNGLRAVTYTAPSSWASYLINGDSSGIDATEKAMCDAWLKRINGGDAVDCEDAGFCKSHDAWKECPLAGDCQTYTFLVRESVKA